VVERLLVWRGRVVEDWDTAQGGMSGKVRATPKAKGPSYGLRGRGCEGRGCMDNLTPKRRSITGLSHQPPLGVLMGHSRGEPPAS